MSYGFKIIIEGDYACFTRPEMKVERVSYDVPTPGALEGIIKSVYWKPAVNYQIDRIIVFNPIEYTTIRRNEVKDKVSIQKVREQMNGYEADPCIYTAESRSQRAAMILKNVKYGVEFHFDLTGQKCEREEEGEKKHYNILKRRLEKGQTFRTPCLGCSEFPVKKIYLVECFDMDMVDNRLRAEDDRNLGFMLYKMKFMDNGIPVNNDWTDPKFNDQAEAVYYRPHLCGGIIDVAKYREGTVC